MKFKFECWRSSNIFAKFEIHRIVVDVCIRCESHFHALINAKHGLALNAVNDSQHMSHNCKQCRSFSHPRHHLLLGGMAAAAVAVTCSVGLSHTDCYMRHLAIIIGMAMHALGPSAELCCKILRCFLHPCTKLL